MPKGRSSSVVTTLNRVCILAICAEGLPGVQPSTKEVRGKNMHAKVKRMVPMMLNIRWIMVVRLALRLVPIEARTAVMQVPMFWPKSTYTALFKPISPDLARV